MAKMQIIAVVCDNCNDPIEDIDQFGSVVVKTPDGITHTGEWCLKCISGLPTMRTRKRQSTTIPGMQTVKRALDSAQENRDSLTKFLDSGGKR